MSMGDFVGDFFGGIKPSKRAKTRNSKKNGGRVMMEEMDDFGIPAFNGRFGQVGEGFLENIGELKTGRIDFAQGGKSQSAISPLFQTDFGARQPPLLRATRRPKGRRRAAPKVRRTKTNGNGKKDERPTVTLGVVAGRGIKRGISGLAERIRQRKQNGKNGSVTFASGLNGNGNGNGKKNGNGNGKKNGNGNDNGNGKKNGNGNNNGNGNGKRNG